MHRLHSLDRLLCEQTRNGTGGKEDDDRWRGAQAVNVPPRSWWLRWLARFSRPMERASVELGPTPDRPACAAPEAPPAATAAHDLPSLVETMLTQQRYCLLLRARIKETLSDEQMGQAREALEASMAKLPAGLVGVGPRNAESVMGTEQLQRVEPLLIDRHPVTNRQFKQFVEAGGYDLLALWEAEVWPALAEFVDLSGLAGPRFWRSGRYPSGEVDHPVVGVNWYEAAAYARWVGKRLPSDSEWVKAAACPIPLSDGQVSQRRFPWGDVMDRGRCNVWGSGPGRTAAVSQFSAGVSVGGVYQLIGNVWEWNSGDFDDVDAIDGPVDLPAPMKSIRGGAFDTYFEHQACCEFRSGENRLARKHNLGFRCALSLCDVAESATEIGVDV